ncbi:Hypothetical protein SMAX5B_007098 [Scophthalmus maximus]|uniref:Uncharacterized protein n=1 Tax=Scophthalmus maximus TaxID=52904 RepID=A0A2U9B0N1_SCOMX|nr:Hypothetical protein SMAX5B_007098 [Scophthalmus maximus]
MSPVGLCSNNTPSASSEELKCQLEEKITRGDVSVQTLTTGKSTTRFTSRRVQLLRLDKLLSHSPFRSAAAPGRSRRQRRDERAGRRFHQVTRRDLCDLADEWKLPLRRKTLSLRGNVFTGEMRNPPDDSVPTSHTSPEDVQHLS